MQAKHICQCPDPNQSRPCPFDVGRSDTATRDILDCFQISLPSVTAAFSCSQVSHSSNINDSPPARQQRRQKSVKKHLCYILWCMCDELVLPYLLLAMALAPLRRILFMEESSRYHSYKCDMHSD